MGQWGRCVTAVTMTLGQNLLTIHVHTHLPHPSTLFCLQSFVSSAICSADWFVRDSNRQSVPVFSWGCRFCVLTLIHICTLFVVTRALFRHCLSITVIRWRLSLECLPLPLSLCCTGELYMTNNHAQLTALLSSFIDSLPPVVSRTTFPRSLWRSHAQCVGRRPFCQRRECVLCKTTSSSLISWRLDSYYLHNFNSDIHYMEKRQTNNKAKV